ncbi:MAG: exodeoxyribonuclease VII large subunit [Vampirovibrionales bacterium]|nr:exodeoxyribonuclease VII large subunit [Vampirovibrionales bacterium]
MSHFKTAVDQLSLLGTPPLPSSEDNDTPKVSPASKTPRRKKAPSLLHPENAPSSDNSMSDRPSSYTVSQLTQHLQGVLQDDPVLGQTVTVRGELSNHSPSSRGHVYFQLKDDSASLKAVVWSSVAARLPFNLQNGLDVYATGTVEVYAPSGSYSLVVKTLEPVGVGALQLAFQQLKERLDADGCFDPELKQPLPSFPWRLGIITAKTGAVIHDMLRVIRRKNPLVSVLLHPVSVQGVGAAQSIANAITELNRPEYGLDLLIVGRGGGSFEDLFCFSEEPVVRAIVASKVPIVAGIGHEPDFSLADAAADLSCSTPTAAAEAAVPDVVAMQQQFEAVGEYLARELQQRLNTDEQRLDAQADRLCEMVNRQVQIATHLLAQHQQTLTHVGEQLLNPYEHHLAQQVGELDGLSPLKTLARGYAVAQHPTGAVITSIHQLAPQETITLRFSDGGATASIQTIQSFTP